jgi:acetyl/propionyl-CoA carboxylase alpha subunit
MAVAIASAARLTNAATAEFLREPDGQFRFLEVNTRLQVEHGVTELVTGVDIVREQFLLAAGRPLSDATLAAAARAATPDRHAIEVRIAAEDPGRDFVPTPGVIRHWVMPAGPGVRVDTAIEAGDRVPPDYDNLIAKVMVDAGDRETAISRLARALDETEIAGIQTTLPFHRLVARDDSFAAGSLSTDWVAEHWDGEAEAARAEGLARAAATLAVEPTRASVLAQRQPVGSRPAGEDGRFDEAWHEEDWSSAALVAGVDRWPG